MISRVGRVRSDDGGTKIPRFARNDKTVGPGDSKKPETEIFL